MSDGERAVFYLLGQTLVAAKHSVLVIDEPKLHLHPSIMALLWDELGAARPDCAFVFITHSLEFSASRPGEKYIVREYLPGPAWNIERLPQDSGFSEEFNTLILGTRRLVLFVEGTSSSLDRSIYSACYPDYLVLPLESCEAVIHAVASMRKNAALTRVECRGIVDGDHRSEDELQYLQRLGIAVLPVAMLENVFLLPQVSGAIAAHEGHVGDDLDVQLNALRQAVFQSIASAGQRRATVLKCVTRRVDRHLKRINLGAATDVEELGSIVAENAAALDMSTLASNIERSITTAVERDDLPNLLAYYDNKNLLALAASHLKQTKLSAFKTWLERVLRNGSAPGLTAAIQSVLPELP